MSRKKIVFVIVEGASDETALGVALNRLYNKDEVYVHIMHGDITAKRGINGGNIVASIGNEVKRYASSRHYKKADFAGIIHIADMDGAYIPDDKVIQDESLERVLYLEKEIRTPNREQLIGRNHQKRENLFRLQRQPMIWEIPYRIYYMSCNLDHVLHNKRNSSYEEKENDAYAFALKYKYDQQGFVSFMCESFFSVKGSYSDTWKHIEMDTNSLERFTNFNICIEDVMRKKEED